MGRIEPAFRQGLFRTERSNFHLERFEGLLVPDVEQIS